jgi:hypothetical protein
MKRLSRILYFQEVPSRRRYTLELAELYREQGDFEHAQHIILNIYNQNVDVTRNLIATLIKDKLSVPMRYSM